MRVASVIILALLAAGAAPVDPKDHWSFKPIANPTLPSASNHSWPRNPIDQFILARLDQEHLKSASEADRATWLRRVTLDLTGLPPQPSDIASFLTDQSDGAYERAVDRLLASPRYGERWAQHWLDVVRYADTHGFEVNTERPNAWPFRDYVIRAFNSDTPYDRFIREQIVGDALGEDAATGFLVTASVLLPGQIGADEPSKRLARQDALDDIVVNVGQTVLGLSIGCGRCHDHKFDPISQKDYYSMQAFFAGVEYLDRDLHTPEAKIARAEKKKLTDEMKEIDAALAHFEPLYKSGARRVAVNSRVNVDRFVPRMAKRVRFTIKATNILEPCIDELEVYDTAGHNIALASNGTVPVASGSLINANRHDPSFVNDGKYGNSHSWLSNKPGGGWIELQFPKPYMIERVVWGRDREGKLTDRLSIRYEIEAADEHGELEVISDSSDREPYHENRRLEERQFTTDGLSESEKLQAAPLIKRRKAIQARLNAVAEQLQVFAGQFRKPDDIHVLRRGDPEQPKDGVTPAVPIALGSMSLAADAPEQDRRRAVAEWLVQPANPLTARVMVNRIWQGHFGLGLVSTPNDFGHNGVKPSHPELLDWLASRFIESGWSIKQMHRLIVLSATYRQASTIEPAAMEKDADDRLLWRFPSRRLDAEEIRDEMLYVSGRLDLTMYGRGYNLFNQRGGLSGYTPIESFTPAGLRRMIYAHKVRRERDAVFGAFDCPDGGQSMSRRRESTTPIQALNLFNSQFTIEAADAMAQRIVKETHASESEQIKRVYECALGRPPSSSELAEVEPIVREHGLATLCRAIFNSNEFLFLP